MLGGERADNERVVRTRNKIILNVGGLRHETYVGTLRNIPDTRLYSLTNNNPTQVPEFDPNSGEFFFDRHPLVFAQILNYYRTGKLHCPNDVCGPIFEEELAFWGLEDASIETCCWMNYKKHGEAQANLSSFDRIVEEAASEHEYSFYEEGEVGLPMRSYRQVLRKYKSRVWLTLEEPSSSLTAKIIAMLSMLFIITSVIISCLETMEYFSESESTQHQVIHICEIICVVWFTAEILIRFIVCPSKRTFIKQIMNWLDFAAIIPFYVQLFLTNTEMNSILALRIIRLIRVFRVFKLSRHSYSLQILGHTLRSSLSELFLLGFFLSIGVVVFSTLMFYAEHESNKKFSSIPAGFWWAVVTMTTLGYGDIYPYTVPGKLVGTACAICGVLTIALPIPVIVSNFSLYYSHAKAKQKASQRKRPLVIGAANALKVIDPFVGSRATNLRLSVMSENACYVNPSSRVRTWSKIALDMAGSSVDSSEPPASPIRRRFSKLPDKLWQFDQARHFDNRKQGNESKITDVISAPEISEDYPRDCTRNSNDCTNIVPKGSEDMSTHSSKIRNRMSITSHAQDEPCQDLAKCSHPSEIKKCDGAYENEAIEQNSENENKTRAVPITFEFDDAEFGSDEDNMSQGEQYYRYHNTLPKIEIICNSSASQMSGSNNEDETNEKSNQKSSKKKTKKKLKRSHYPVEKATSAPSLAETTQGFSGKNLPGRMGRRGSVFVVGFLGKRWQAKAAKSRKNRAKSKPDSIELSPNKSHLDLLQVSPSISSRVSTPNEDMSRRTSTTGLNTPNSSISSKSMIFRFPGDQSLSESNFFRRSSCPTLQTLNSSENKIDFSSPQNDCRNHKENDSSVQSRDIKVDHKENGSLEETRSTNIAIGEALLDTKQPERDTKNYQDNTKHKEVETEHNEADTKHVGPDTTHYEGEKRSTEKATNITKIHEKGSKVDTNFSELNRELSENTATRFDSNANNPNRKSKQETLAKNQHSLSSTQSGSSLKAKFDGTVQRSSSPLIRQRAFMSFQGREGKTLDDSDNEDEGPSDRGSEQIFDQDYHGHDRKATNGGTNNQFGSDLVKTKLSNITLMEISKNQPSSSKFPTADKKGKGSPKTFKKENTKQDESENTRSSTVQKTYDDVHNSTKHSPHNNGLVIDAKTTAQSKLGGKIKKTTTETLCDKPKIKPDNQAIITNEVSWEDISTIEPVKDTGKSSSLRFSQNEELESTKSLQAIEIFSENENTSDRNNGIHIKRLMNDSLPENSGLENQGLINGHKDETEISPRDIDHTNESNFDQDHSDMDKNFGYMNNNRPQNGGNHHGLTAKQPVTIQNNDRKSTDEPKYESIDLSECSNQTINTHKDLTNSSSKSKRNLESITVNKNLWSDTVDSKYPNFYSRNSAYIGRQYHSLKSSISSHGSADQSTSFEYTMDSGMLRKVEAQDSGIYCSDYRSSIDSVSSFTERNNDRGILKTISEVEHDYRDCMLYFQPFPGQYYEKSRSCVLEIRDETAV